MTFCSSSALVRKGSWTREDDELFEAALAVVHEDTSDRWVRVAAMVPGKDAFSVKRHYDLLVEDVNSIESGKVCLPSYHSSVSSTTGMFEDEAVAGPSANFYMKNGARQSIGVYSGGKAGTSKSNEQERRKGVPWTEEEHRLFLLGLDKFGKGDWRSISRNFVVSRTPTQVASHAQKYFIRLNSFNKDRKRASIHDITSVEKNPDLKHHQQGQEGGAIAPTLPSSTVYGQTIMGHPGGTSVSLPSPGVTGQYIARRSVVPGTGVSMVYPAPHHPMSQPAVYQ